MFFLLTKYKCFTLDGSKVAAFGRDQLMSVWEVESQTCLHLVPTYEELERALVLDQAVVEQVIGGEFSKDKFCLAAGEKGQVNDLFIVQQILMPCLPPGVLTIRFFVGSALECNSRHRGQR